jgi:transposase-like protein
VKPWCEVKSRRGRKKRIDTEGHACWNKECDYYGVTDARIHALVGYGHHGKGERIQDLFCQACQTKVSERRDTALYRLKTPAQRVGEVLAMLAEGLDVNAAVRVSNHTEATIQRWLTRAGMHGERMHQHFFQHLELKHIQLDEIKARLREKTQELWVWVAIDVPSKVIPVLEVGRRTQAMANRVVHRLKETLALGCLPVFTTDGLRQYFYALTAHWGQWVMQEGKRKPQWQVSPGLLYGQVIKRYRRRRVVRVEHVMQWGVLAELKTRLKALGLSGRLNTAFVERVNLTIRQGVSMLIRRTWGTAQTEGGLKLRLAWWQGYYHFIRPHLSLRMAYVQPIPRKGGQLAKRYRSRTPAMAAGLTDHRWTAKEFLSHPLPVG